MTWQTLVHELGREQPKTIKELLDIATKHTFGEEVVRVVFVQGDGKAAPSGSRGTSAAATNKGMKRDIKSNKRWPRRQPQRVAVTASWDEEMNGKDAGYSDEELVVDVS
jgi:hypothetical protein